MEADHICMIVIGLYCIGIVFTMLVFVIYWYKRTNTRKLPLLFWAGFAIGLVWPFLLLPCPLVILYMYAPFFKELFQQRSVPPVQEPKLYPVSKPKVVVKIDSALGRKLGANNSCAICCEHVNITPEELREPLDTEVVVRHPTLNEMDTCVTLCGHVFPL